MKKLFSLLIAFSMLLSFAAGFAEGETLTRKEYIDENNVLQWADYVDADGNSLYLVYYDENGEIMSLNFWTEIEPAPEGFNMLSRYDTYRAADEHAEFYLSLRRESIQVEKGTTEDGSVSYNVGTGEYWCSFDAAQYGETALIFSDYAAGTSAENVPFDQIPEAFRAVIDELCNAIDAVDQAAVEAAKPADETVQAAFAEVAGGENTNVVQIFQNAEGYYEEPEPSLPFGEAEDPLPYEEFAKAYTPYGAYGEDMICKEIIENWNPAVFTVVCENQDGSQTEVFLYQLTSENNGLDMLFHYDENGDLDRFSEFEYEGDHLNTIRYYVANDNPDAQDIYEASDLFGTIHCESYEYTLDGVPGEGCGISFRDEMNSGNNNDNYWSYQTDFPYGKSESGVWTDDDLSITTELEAPDGFAGLQLTNYFNRGSLVEQRLRLLSEEELIDDVYRRPFIFDKTIHSDETYYCAFFDSETLNLDISFTEANYGKSADIYDRNTDSEEEDVPFNEIPEEQRAEIERAYDALNAIDPAVLAAATPSEAYVQSVQAKAADMLAMWRGDSEAFYRPLGKGCKGEDVKRLQQALIDLGYLDGSADGSFGDGSEAAVKAFQKDKGIEETGLVGLPTLKALFPEMN